jgi:hypothetical protein
MSPHQQLAHALVASLDDAALDTLAALLAPRLAAVQTEQPAAGYMTPKAAATYAGLSIKRIYDLTSSGALVPDGRDGRTPLFTRQTVDAYVRQGAQRG